MKAITTANFDLGSITNGEIELHKGETWDLSYASISYTNGTTCDLIPRPRASHVRFFCHPDEAFVLANFKEIATCEYIFTVHTNLVCSHPDFKPEVPQITEIVCVPLDASGQITTANDLVGDKPMEDKLSLPIPVEQSIKEQEQEQLKQQQIKEQQIKQQLKDQQLKDQQLKDQQLKDQQQQQQNKK